MGTRQPTCDCPHLNLPRASRRIIKKRACRPRPALRRLDVLRMQDVLRKQMMDDSDADESTNASSHKLDAMLGLCKITSCRRQSLLAYSAKPWPCLAAIETMFHTTKTWDAVSAQRRFRRASHWPAIWRHLLIRHVTGKDDGQDQAFGQIKLAPLASQDMISIPGRSIFRQLIARGLLGCRLDRLWRALLTELSPRVARRGKLSLRLS